MTIQESEKILIILQTFIPDLILMDPELSGVDGYNLCCEIRLNSNIPIIILSEKGTVSDKVYGLDHGADDYIVKPFDSREVIARIKAVLRRCNSMTSDLSGADNIIASDLKYVSYPGIEINLTNYEVILDGTTTDMPPKELELLYFLASSPNQVFTREQLLDQIWGYEYIGDTRTVDAHIKRLRKKIKDHETWRLATVWGIGYKFEVKQHA